MSSVWVCEYLQGRMMSEKTKCEYFVNGKCLSQSHQDSSKQCDAVEYAPVKRGKWLTCERNGNIDTNEPDGCKCSACGYYEDFDSFTAWGFCKFCGAKMEAE